MGLSSNQCHHFTVFVLVTLLGHCATLVTVAVMTSLLYVFTNSTAVSTFITATITNLFLYHSPNLFHSLVCMLPNMRVLSLPLFRCKGYICLSYELSGATVKKKMSVIHVMGISCAVCFHPLSFSCVSLSLSLSLAPSTSC